MKKITVTYGVSGESETTPEDRFLETVMAAISQLHTAMLSTKIKEGLKLKKTKQNKDK